VGGHDDHRNVGVALRDTLAELEPVHAVHAHVADEDFDVAAIESLQRGLRGGGPEHAEAPLPQPRLEQLADERVVVDEEELARHLPRSSGNRFG